MAKSTDAAEPTEPQPTNKAEWCRRLLDENSRMTVERARKQWIANGWDKSASTLDKVSKSFASEKSKRHLGRVAISNAIGEREDRQFGPLKEYLAEMLELARQSEETAAKLKALVREIGEATVGKYDTDTLLGERSQ